MSFQWDDFRVFLIAGRAGTLHAAAHILGVDPATVGRRISRLETALKATLLVRSAAGLELTATGVRLAESGDPIETAMNAITRASERGAAAGMVRVSAAEGFGSAIMAPALPDLRRAHAGLRIELAAQSNFLSPSKREVDIAVTLSAPARARLVIEPLTDYALGLYASTQYLRDASAPKMVSDLQKHAIVGYIDDLLPAPELRYLDEILPGLRASLSSSSIRAQREIILAGGGIGVLPCFLGEGLQRVLGEKVRLSRRFWMSTHRDVADLTRVRLVRDWLRKLVRKNRTALQGVS